MPYSKEEHYHERIESAAILNTLTEHFPWGVMTDAEAGMGMALTYLYNNYPDDAPGSDLNKHEFRGAAEWVLNNYDYRHRLESPEQI